MNNYRTLTDQPDHLRDLQLQRSQSMASALFPEVDRHLGARLSAASKDGIFSADPPIADDLDKFELNLRFRVPESKGREQDWKLVQPGIARAFAKSQLRGSLCVRRVQVELEASASSQVNEWEWKWIRLTSMPSQLKSRHGTACLKLLQQNLKLTRASGAIFLLRIPVRIRNLRSARRKTSFCRHPRSSRMRVGPSFELPLRVCRQNSSCWTPFLVFLILIF